MLRLACAALVLSSAGSAQALDTRGLDRALRQLTETGRFSGAVVIRSAEGVRFARGYGPADPFTGRRFTPATPVDSGSLAKPVTAAGVLLLARDRKVALDQPVRLYLPEYPHAATTVRHLLAHSAGLEFRDSPGSVAGMTNESLLAEVRRRGAPPLFAPGSAFAYCNLCFSTLAMLIERVGGMHYLHFARARLRLPASVTLRPQRLADWEGRAIGYRRTADGRLERFDSWEGEAFYGTANLSISAADLALWGSEWWHARIGPVGSAATAPARIAGKPSGLTLGNWYCARGGRRCHYLGHHEGFHHMLYWDADRRLSVAMVTNNGLAPDFHQPLQRAIVAFAEGRSADAERELATPLPAGPVVPGVYEAGPGETLAVNAAGKRLSLRRHGIDYPAYPVGPGVRYVPGLDAYLAGDASGRLRFLTLYEYFTAPPLPPRR